MKHRRGFVEFDERIWNPENIWLQGLLLEFSNYEILTLNSGNVIVIADFAEFDEIESWDDIPQYMFTWETYHEGGYRRNKAERVTGDK